MTPSNLRLIVTDLDGTLLHSDGTLSEWAIHTLNRAASAGLKIVFATARSKWSALPFVHATGVVEFLISSNGAVVTQTRPAHRIRTVRTVTMPVHLARGIIDKMASVCPEAAWAVDRRADRLVSPSWPEGLLAPRRLQQRAKQLESGAEVLCLMIVGSSLELAMMLAEQMGVTCTSSQAGLMEFSASGADKSSALRWVLDQLALEPQQVMAYGDALNDLPMLTLAGTAIAVANACGPVRCRADEVVATNGEDGVAHHLNRVLLGFPSESHSASSQEK